jgi:SagB-type dehydrogenase family enzyme
LPIIKREGDLYEILLKRKTTRTFNAHAPMTLEELSVILYYVYGCHGYSPAILDIIGLKRTSPSGGGLHPTEVYPLVINVDGVHPGLYHYNMENHALEMIASLNHNEASELANEFTAGQSYPRWAGALFIMTARFYRNFWKYRKHQKTYSVLFMDAAHLSQTFYSVCTELGLGAFVSAAISSVNIEERLRLDGFREGAIAICGCGKPLDENFNLEPKFFPYTPREMTL